MSIQSEINRISGNVSDALDAIEAKGVTIPSGSNSDDLADLIAQIPSVEIPTYTATIGTLGAYRNYIYYDNVRYLANSSFEFSAGDSCTIRVYGEYGGATIYEDGTQIGTSDSGVTYTYVLPSSDIEIVTSGSGGAARVDITTGGGVSLQAKTNINPTTSSQTITADAGYDGLSSVQINAMPSGSATPAANITGSGASVTVGTNTITLSKTISNTPQVTAGYVSSGTAGNSNVSLVASVNTRSSSDLTISGTTVTAPAGYYSSAASATVPVSTITVSSSNPTGGNNGDVWIKTS